MRSLLKLSLGLSVAVLLISCTNSGNKTLSIHSSAKAINPDNKPRPLTEEFKDYWYKGEAEITSYELKQERYGEIRDGKAVMVFVTEDFLPDAQVKANRRSDETIPVLKMNQTKKYLTGIYPYSVMTSVFSPVDTHDHAVKISHSMQEWCGQVYVQLNNKEQYEVTSHSYFAGEADQQTSFSKTWLESEIWNLIRINPDALPTDEFTILPSFEYFRMSHGKMGLHKAEGQLVKGNSTSVYTLTYNDIKRKLKIHFSNEFPFTIERWEETNSNGLTTTAQRLKQIKTDYWNKNGNDDLPLRDELGL